MALDDIRTTVEPLQNLLSFSGIYYDKNTRSFYRRALQILYCLLMAVIQWCNIGRMIWCIVDFHSVNANVLVNSSYVIFYASMTVILSVFTITSYQRLPDAIDSMQKLHRQFGQPSYMIDSRSKLRKLLFAICLSVSVMMSSMLVAFSTSEEAKTGRMCMMAPFTADSPVQYYGTLPAFMLVALVVTLGITLIFMSFSLACYALHKEFSANSEWLRELLREKERMSHHDAERVRLQYEQIVNLANKFNRLFSLPILGAYGSVIPFCVLTVFAVTSERFTILFTLQAITNLLIVIGGVLSLTMAGEFVTSKSQEIKNVILQADFSGLDSKVTKSLHVFLVRLTGSPVGFWAGGMFMVDSSACLTIFGVVTTYTVVIFQFQPPTSVCHAGSILMNNTLSL